MGCFCYFSNVDDRIRFFPEKKSAKLVRIVVSNIKQETIVICRFPTAFNEEELKERRH